MDATSAFEENGFPVPVAKSYQIQVFMRLTATRKRITRCLEDFLGRFLFRWTQHDQLADVVDDSRWCSDDAALRTHSLCSPTLQEELRLVVEFLHYHDITGTCIVSKRSSRLRVGTCRIMRKESPLRLPAPVDSL